MNKVLCLLPARSLKASCLVAVMMHQCTRLVWFLLSNLHEVLEKSPVYS